MTANPVKAPRYRPGKVVAESESSDSDASDVEQEQQPEKQTAPKPTPKYTSAGGISSSLKQVDLNERRRAAAEAEAARVAEEKARRAEEEEGFVTEESEDEDDSEGSEEESGDEESESEEEAPRRVFLRPTFIKKDKRNAAAVAVNDAGPDEAKLAEEEARKKASIDELVEEQIKKDLAAKAAGKKHWDDEEDDADDVDDTDDLDPEAEYAAWKLRELRRIKRDREAIEAKERELEEIERRKNLTEEERKAEDDAYLAKQKEEKDSKGKMSYMQKYYHKGAFFQDDLKAEGLDRRDIMGSRFADDVQNRELLPQALQMRDMTKLGKKGATKYKDLKTEDTGSWGRFDDRRQGRATGPYGADDRFMPERDRAGPSGANTMPVGQRSVPVDAPNGPRAQREEKSERGGGRDSYRSSDRDSRRYSRSRSRSRSPRRDYRDEERSRRKRSSSRERDRYDGDKRRRIDTR
jgi:microfibrillar-associated protein 1